MFVRADRYDVNESFCVVEVDRLAVVKYKRCRERSGDETTKSR